MSTSKSKNIKITTNNDHMIDLFYYCNSHLTIMEKATEKSYELKENRSSDRIVLPEPIKMTDEEYINHFVPSTQQVTTQMLGDSCSICQEYYLPEQKFRQMNCDHHFHQKCIDSWLSQNKDQFLCPLCRRSQYH